MADDDQAIWDSASTETEVVTEAPVIETTEQAARDERGRFAAKAEEPAVPVTTEQPQPKDTGQGIPPWRLKEEADARRAAEERATNYERMLADLQRQSKEPKQPVPDIFEDAQGFVDHRTGEAINPVKNEINQLREFYSQRDAIRSHGADKVNAAYQALDQAAKTGDPEAQAVVQRVKKSLDPYGEMVGWHQNKTILSEIGNDPNAYVERQLEERLKDPAYQAKVLERIRGAAQARPSVVTPLPPSLNRATSAAPPGADGEDDSDAGLLRSALRR